MGLRAYYYYYYYYYIYYYYYYYCCCCYSYTYYNNNNYYYYCYYYSMALQSLQDLDLLHDHLPVISSVCTYPPVCDTHPPQVLPHILHTL